MPTRYSGFFHPVTPTLDHIWRVVEHLRDKLRDLADRLKHTDERVDVVEHALEGGHENDFLTKASDADFDTRWTPVSIGPTLDFCGPWDPTRTYHPGQAVLGSDNQLYIALADTTAQDPTVPVSPPVWQVVQNSGFTDALTALSKQIGRLADQVAPVALNLLPIEAAGFEDGTTGGWTGQNAAVANSITDAHSGTRSLQLTANATLGTGTQCRQTFPIPAALIGRPVTFSAWSQPLTTATGAMMYVQWLNSAGTALGGFTGGTRVATPLGAWTQFTFTGTPPAGAAQVTIAVEASQTSTLGNQYLVDDIVMTAVES